MDVLNASDRELWEAFYRQMDEGAFEALVNRYQDLVIHAALRILGNREDAKDAAQAVFLVLVRKSGHLREVDLLGPYLFRMATYIALRMQKARAAQRRREEKFRGEESRMKTQPPSGEAFERRASVTEALAGLPERYRVPLILHHLQNQSLEEVARTLRCSMATLNKRLYRGREKLRVRLRLEGILPASALSAYLTGMGAGGGLGASFAAQTARGACFLLAKEQGRPAKPDPGLPEAVFALAQRSSRALYLASFFRWAAAFFLAAGLLGITGLGLGWFNSSASPNPRPGENLTDSPTGLKGPEGDGYLFYPPFDRLYREKGVWACQGSLLKKGALISELWPKDLCGRATTNPPTPLTLVTRDGTDFLSFSFTGRPGAQLILPFPRPEGCSFRVEWEVHFTQAPFPLPFTVHYNYQTQNAEVPFRPDLMRRWGLERLIKHAAVQIPGNNSLIRLHHDFLLAGQAPPHLPVYETRAYIQDQAYSSPKWEKGLPWSVLFGLPKTVKDCSGGVPFLRVFALEILPLPPGGMGEEKNP